MKTHVLYTILCLSLLSCASQNRMLSSSGNDKEILEQKILIRPNGTLVQSKSPLYVIDGVPMGDNSTAFQELDPNDIVSVKVLKDEEGFFCFRSPASNGIVVITTKVGLKNAISPQPVKHPFKTFKVCNENWTLSQDMYNSIKAKVPGITIGTTDMLNSTPPNIRIRAQGNPIVILDGIRTDVSIFATINPADIEHITIANNAAAAQYLLTR